eukprot:Nitzschia sp. Nitz4//scaffold143_size57137//35336//37402//NITZ4_006516-RA/size57137-processed-gene-0.38-mRNA-1//1//CDS//3329536452//4238//frame0
MPKEAVDEILNINIGVLGHVDSGKTSLVKTLSTLLSTAALDKSKQSRQRGMTLDLGFSCFFLDMPEHLAPLYPEHKQVQLTLVDCPGHASLIRTIIGGAQIIHMMVLVVDAYKGWQAQTTECLVLAEWTSPHLMIALNKIDMFPEDEREVRLEEAKQRIRQQLQGSKFSNVPMVGVSACVGGEKVAATTGTSTVALDNKTNPTYNVDHLVQVLRTSLPAPHKSNNDASFYFAIDHCFPIKGMGTVLTGTCLSGECKVNDMIKFPVLGLERKVKSMQMFKRATKKIQQGDRAGICVSSLDSTSLERGMASTPGTVPIWKGAIALVRKIAQFPGTLKNGAKFHVSVGHTTVMATISFWGASELHEHSVATKDDTSQLPTIPFDWNQDFLLQDGLVETLQENSENDVPDAINKESLLHWAVLEFQTPVYCPLNSLVIGSRLDVVDTNNHTSAGPSASSCRLAFCGRLIESMQPQDKTKIRWYTPKSRQGTVSKLGDPHKRQDDDKVVRYEVFGADLFKKETVLKPFLGMKLVTPQGDVGEIKSAFGTSGKFRVYFPAGTTVREGETLSMPFKRFQHDPEKKMRQDLVLPNARPGSRLETKAATKVKPEAVGKIDRLKGDVSGNGKYPQAIVEGFFTPKVNVRDHIGKRVVVPSTSEIGKIAGSFGKAGKCKVDFEEGLSAPVGAKVEMYSS